MCLKLVRSGQSKEKAFFPQMNGNKREYKIKPKSLDSRQKHSGMTILRISSLICLGKDRRCLALCPRCDTTVVVRCIDTPSPSGRGLG